MTSGNGSKVFTIGHSTMPIAAFMSILKQSGITAVADVRSTPFSRRAPHFSRDEFRITLKKHDVKYAFLGKELGGRPQASHLYCEGIADYEKMAMQPDFLKGIGRVLSGAQEHTIALMCSEHNPLDCHRCLLVGRILSERQAVVRHILNNGRVTEHAEIEEKLLSFFDGPTGDMFAPRETRLADAYRVRARNVAYRQARPLTEKSVAPNWDDHAS